ncbi:MAG: TolC family protein [Candidatus Eremiobacteraeota bacterium]|nr:TolC family protein [Candidatus Eremiobacteraeota bacterium]
MLNARLFGALFAFGLLAPIGALAQNQPMPVEMPSPLPTPAPNGSPIPYPAYGTPAPDVAQLTPHAGVPAVVALDQAEKLAVALSPTFAGQNAAWAAIHAKYASAYQALFPAISGTATMGSTYSNGTATTASSRTGGGTGTGSGAGAPDAATTSPPIGVFSRSSITQEAAGITISQLIYDGGRTIAAIHSAKSADLSGRGTLLRQLETLQLSVANGYYAVLADNATVAADVQLVREFETNENSVRAQIRNGAAARSDLAAAQFQTAQARGQLVTAQGTAIGAQATFATTLGLDADVAVVPRQIGTETPQSNPTYAVALKRAFILRPDFVAAQYTVVSSEENLRFAKLARFPVLVAGASDTTGRNFLDCSYASGKQNEHPSETTCPGPSGYSNTKVLGLTLTVPIYDQGVTNYNVAVAQSQLDQAKANLQLTKLTVESDVRSALANLISARANLVQAIASRNAAQVSLDATQAQYKVGAATILNLVTAEANLSTAFATYISAEYGVRTAEQNYLYATGASDLQL